MNLTQRITKWNYDRNGLNFDYNLETSMLSEEASEFMQAYSNADIIEMIDAITDLKFVLVGTRAKLNFLHEKKYGDFFEKVAAGEEILDYFEEKYVYFLDLFDSFIKSEGKQINDLALFFNKCLEIVTDANEAKSSKLNDDGKVSKPKDFIPPQENIEKLYYKFAKNIR